MDIRQISFFVSLAETGSFGGAADSLFITRQGLSRSIAALERECGTKLFLRSGSGVRLTEHGQAFLPHAERIRDEYEAAMRDVFRDGGEEGGAVRFVLPYSFWKNVRIDMLLLFQEKTPGLEFFPKSVPDDAVLKTFREGQYDFAITTDPKIDEAFDYHPLFTNYRCLAVGQDHPLAALPRLHTRDLEGWTVAVTSNGFFDGQWLEDRSREHGVEIHLMQIGDGLTSAQMAESGRVPTLQVGNINGDPVAGASKILFWDTDELESTAIRAGIVTRKGSTVPAHVRGLIRFAQGYCRKCLSENRAYPYR